MLQEVAANFQHARVHFAPTHVTPLCVRLDIFVIAVYIPEHSATTEHLSSHQISEASTLCDPYAGPSSRRRQLLLDTSCSETQIELRYRRQVAKLSYRESLSNVDKGVYHDLKELLLVFNLSGYCVPNLSDSPIRKLGRTSSPGDDSSPRYSMLHLKGQDHQGIR